jgi:hypothetical protein
MSKHETPLTRRFWTEVGGTLIEEYQAVRRTSDQGQRLLDGLIIRDGPHEVSKDRSAAICGKDVIVVQTKAARLGMYLLGQALFSRHLVEALGPRSVETVAVCRKGDATLEPLADQYGIKVVVYDV